MLIRSPHGRPTMTLSLLQPQRVFVLVLAVLLCPLDLAQGQGLSETQSPSQVLQDLLSRYGDNATITVPQLRSLLARLSQDQSEGEGDGHHMDVTPTNTPLKTNHSKVRT